MEEWNKIFEINKKLDEEFIKKCNCNSEEYYKKNCIELIVEISEFANETKCFKYWSIKSADKDKVLEEYADAITMTLSFFTTLNVELDNIGNHCETDDVIVVFNELFKDASCMLESGSEELIKRIFSNLIYVGELLNYSKEDIYEACYKKMNIVRERLNSNY